MKRRIVCLLLCLFLLGGLCAVPAMAAFQVTYYNEEVYAGGILDLRVFVGEEDLSGYTFQWQAKAYDWFDLEDNNVYKGTKTNHLQVYTDAGNNYTEWDTIPFQCVVTKDGVTQYTPDIYMHIVPFSKLKENLKYWNFGLYEPSISGVTGLSAQNDTTYTANTYAGTKLDIICGGNTATQKDILRNSEIELRREIRITENNKYIVTGDHTTYTPYTIGTNAVKVEMMMRVIIAGVDKGVYQTKTVNITTKKPESIARGVTKKECSMLRYPYNESQTLGSLPQGAVVQVVGKDGSYYQVYARNVISYIPEELLRVDETVSEPLIKHIDITVDRPVAGATPASTCEVCTTGCELYPTDPVTWTDQATGKFMKPGEKFQAGKNYLLTVWVAAQQGYRFQLDSSSNPRLTGAINGDLPPFIHKAYEQDPEKVIELTYEFNAKQAPAHVCSLTKNAKVEPSCTRTGQKEYYHCSCGKYYADANGSNEIDPSTWGILPKTAHAASSWTGNGTHHYKKCTVCKEVIPGTNAPHSGGKATCTEKAVCSTCGLAYGTAEADHRWSPKYHPIDKDGHAYVCAVCKATDTPKAHTPGPDATDKDPQVCTDCGYILVPAKNHTHKLTKVPEVKATCTQGGNEEHYTCSGCADLFADAAGKEKIPSPQSVLTGALGHIASDGFDTDEDFHWRSCTVCGELLTETKMYHEMENGICKTCGYSLKTTIPDTPQTEPDADAPVTESTNTSDAPPVPEKPSETAKKGALPNIFTAAALGGVCFASAILITSAVLTRQRRKTKHKS